MFKRTLVALLILIVTQVLIFANTPDDRLRLTVPAAPWTLTYQAEVLYSEEKKSSLMVDMDIS